MRKTINDRLDKSGNNSIISASNLKSNARFGKLVQFCVQNCPWKLNLVKIEGSYEGFKEKIQGILSFLSPFAEIENWYSSLVLLGIGFIIGQSLKEIPVLKSSGPQLSHGHIHFLFTLIFWYVMEQFTFLGGGSTSSFWFLDKNFKTSRSSLIFHQIQLPGAVLNAELPQLFETVIGIKIWPSIDREITV